MPGENLDRRFARRLLPLALLIGVAVAVAPALTFRWVAAHLLREQAAIYAGQVAAGLQRAAEQQPYLWRYNAAKVLWAAGVHRGQEDIGSVAVLDCAGRALFGPPAIALGTGRVDGPAGQAPVVRGNHVVAHVRVQMDPTRLRRVGGWVTVGAGLFGLLLGLAIYLYPTRVVRRQARRLADTQGVVGVQETERLRIARDLHDGVGQTVTALQVELELARREPDDAAGHLAQATRLADQVLDETRAAVFALRPPQLDDQSLDQALRACAEDFEVRTGTPTAVRVEGAIGAVPEDTAAALLRILQEALTNASRHAAAREVAVVLRRQAGALTLLVSDDGQGFDPGQQQAGAGLRGIRERAAALGGAARIDSVAGQGTRLEVRLPV